MHSILRLDPFSLCSVEMVALCSLAVSSRITKSSTETGDGDDSGDLSFDSNEKQKNQSEIENMTKTQKRYEHIDRVYVSDHVYWIENMVRTQTQNMV